MSAQWRRLALPRRGPPAVLLMESYPPPYQTLCYRRTRARRFRAVGNRLSKIYTRTGDDGSTGLGDGTRVSKDSARVTAYGTVDELNSALGVVLAVDLPDAVRDCLIAVQHQLFDLGGELCIPGHAAIQDDDIERLERLL